MAEKKPSLSFDDIAVGQYVLEREIEGLKALSGELGEVFVRAVECIHDAGGRVIVSGMGKSGHIARKIAATLASTGTPAHFVHPAEASHGDLGVISQEDVVLLLSNSGETAELRDIIAYTRRFSIPLIGMVRRETSALVDAADIAIILPEIPEASPTGAPTTSTLMMLAYGDALAMALLERRGFTRDDFHVYHPGGKLGKAFIRVKDLMHSGDELPLVAADITMSDVLLEMTAKHFGCVGVVDDTGALQGIITDGDLRRHMESDLLSHTAGEVMTAGPVTIQKEQLAVEALNIMNSKEITCLFVKSEEGRVEGILHIHDLLRAGIM